MECVCGMEYQDFRTGLSYRDVYETLWVNSNDPGEWNYKRRGTVLGRWRELKLAMWASHKAECEHYANKYPEEFERWRKEQSECSGTTTESPNRVAT